MLDDYLSVVLFLAFEYLLFGNVCSISFAYFSVVCSDFFLLISRNFFFFPGVLNQEAKIWNTSRICVSSLRRGHANLLCIVPILVYVLLKRALISRNSLKILDIGLLSDIRTVNSFPSFVGYFSLS